MNPKRRLLTSAIAAMLSMTSCTIGHSLQRINQIESYAHLQRIAAMIEKTLDEKRVITKDEAETIIAEVNNGMDGWGNAIIYRRFDEVGRTYLLLSLGSDSTLDVSSVSDYLTHPDEDISDLFNRDIVFRNGLPVTFILK